MRNLLRKFLMGQTKRDHVLFMAPIAVALFGLILVLQESAVIASAWRDPLAVLSQRSPGERQPGALYNTKPVRIALPAPRPSERVLSVVRDRPPIELPLPVVEPPAELVLDDVPLITESPVLLAMNSPTIPNSPVLRSNPTPGCCRGGPGVAVPVPEPATWAMNIFGLFAAGAVLRYRNRRKRGLTSEAAHPQIA